MYQIDEQLHAFSKALKRGKSIRCSPNGQWKVENRLISYLRRLLGLEERRKASLAKAFRTSLDSLEKIPVRFWGEKEKEIPQIVDFQCYIEISRLILQQLDPCISKRAVEEGNLLRRALVALLYRLEDANGGLSPVAVQQELFYSLCQAFQEWKQQHPLFPGSSLIQRGQVFLQETCRYPEFVHLLLSDKKLLAEFFIWAYRDSLPILPFIEFPATGRKIIKAALNGRIGCLGEHHLKVQKVSVEGEKVFEKILSLPFEGCDISILDEEKVIIFRGNYALTIEEIFRVFKNKRIEVGNLELMSEGIINWNCNHWGWWDDDRKQYRAIDLEQSEWWKQLPNLKVLTLKEARRMFGNHLHGNEWNFSLISTRLRKNLDVEDTHAYTNLAIPIGKGSYAIYPFGKYSFEFPPNLLSGLMKSGETKEATIAYPDANVYFTHRDPASYSFALTEGQAMRFIDSIKKDMLLSREGHLVYQITTENCAKWSHEKVEEIFGHDRFPNFFKMPFLRAEPHGFLAAMFAFVKRFPKRWQIPLTKLLHLPIGGYKGRWVAEKGQKVWKSLTHHTFWNDTVIYHPAMLHRQQELGIIGRYVYLGVTSLEMIIQKSYRYLYEQLQSFGLGLASMAQKGIALWRVIDAVATLGSRKAISLAECLELPFGFPSYYRPNYVVLSFAPVGLLNTKEENAREMVKIKSI
ncbi:MAG: hypothetical protein WB791_02525 [Waddliaceae bacterium]